MTAGGQPSKKESDDAGVRKWTVEAGGSSSAISRCALSGDRSCGSSLDEFRVIDGKDVYGPFIHTEATGNGSVATLGSARPH